MDVDAPKERISGRGRPHYGTASFAAGTNAKAHHSGAFVRGDDQTSDIASTGDGQFLVRASGGIWLGTNNSLSIPGTGFLSASTGAHLTTGGVWANSSDAAKKENFTAVDRSQLLEKLAALPITRWNYKGEGQRVQHIGPAGQDFYREFGLGTDDRSTSTIDPAGIALAAVQELHRKSKEIDKLRADRRIA